MEVGRCGCPISVMIFMMYTAPFALMKSAPKSASAADGITALMMWAMLRMEPCDGGVFALFEQKDMPPTLLLASGMFW